MNQGHIKLDQLEVFVLDEADRMLDMGFMPDLKRIISRLPEQRQSLFFSATVSPKIKELTEDLLRNPVRINVTPKVTSVASIEQKVMFVDRKGKQALLNGLLKSSGVDRTLVFTKTKRGADQVTTQLIRGGIKAVAIHGNKSQNARQRALESFRNNHVQVLVATDVAARGIDVDGISHVVNFDLPIEPECYVHRIGRTGRAGATGIAVSFCSGGERGELKAIERLIGHAVPVDKSYKPVETEPEEQRTEPQAHTHSGSYAGARSQSRPPKSSYRGQRPPRRPGAPSQRQSAPRAEGATHVVTHEGGQQRSGNGQHSSSGQGAGNGQSRKPKGRSRRPRARQMG
jgi:ATP-dependent RNA helicase RhlE